MKDVTCDPELPVTFHSTAFRKENVSFSGHENWEKSPLLFPRVQESSDSLFFPTNIQNPKIFNLHSHIS